MRDSFAPYEGRVIQFEGTVTGRSFGVNPLISTIQPSICIEDLVLYVDGVEVDTEDHVNIMASQFVSLLDDLTIAWEGDRVRFQGLVSRYSNRDDYCLNDVESVDW